MFGTHDLLLFVLSGLALNISPGPDTAYIVGRSSQFGWKGGATAALGIGSGCLVHVTAATLGISALLAASATAFTVVKILGAAYLVYIGLRMLLTREKAALAERTARPMDLVAIFRQGFITDVLNPKVALFFLAFLPQFINADAPAKAAAFLFLGAIFSINGTLWNVFVAWFSARLALAFRQTARAQRWIDRILGSLFIYLGVRLAAFQRG